MMLQFIWYRKFVILLLLSFCYCNITSGFSNDYDILEKANTFIVKKEYQEAENILTKYAEENDLNWEFYRIDGKLKYYLNKQDEALDSYKKAIIELENNQSNQDSVIAYLYNNIGASYYRKGNYEKAVQNFEKSLKLKKEFFSENDLVFVSAYNNIGFLYRRLGKFEKALDYFKKAEEILNTNNSNRNHAKIKMNIANIYEDIGRYEEAIIYYNLALEKELMDSNFQQK
jgi:tetratricopeptide (TPR) repeat protein